MNISRNLVLVISLGLLTACGGGGNGVDNQAPLATISFPPAISVTENDSITVRGTASDASGIAVLRVNGIDAFTNDGFLTWFANVPLTPGANTLRVETGDSALNGDGNAAQVLVRNQARITTLSGIAHDTLNDRVLLTTAFRGRRCPGCRQ